MGSSVSLPNVDDNHLDPWWPIENENLSLSQPNLNILSEYLIESENSNQLRNESGKNKKQILVKNQRSSESHNTVDKEVCDQFTTEKEISLEEFKEDLRIKRMARQNAISELHNEISDLRRQLAEERAIVRRLKNGDTYEIITNDAATNTGSDDEGVSGRNSDLETMSPTSLRAQLADAQLALQLANAENLTVTTELGVVRKQVASLKEVITCSKQMIQVREEQVVQLKGKLHEIEESLAERELNIMSDNLRREYDRQLANIRNLRQLYEERARVSAAERENLLHQISIKKDELAAEIEKKKCLEERIAGLESDLSNTSKSLSKVTTERDEGNYENRDLKSEMAVINKLFSQMLLGFNGTNSLDIDRLTTMLEDNRSLLNEMATKEVDSEGACLPKLLFDIVKQANNDEIRDSSIENELETKVASTEEIIGNLPKVWRVLTELLSHHKIEHVQFQENGQSEDCYKSVQTPTGPKTELSVSKTYIKLKDLIIEKKALQKETNKLKTLNSHLERRLHEQEKRLSTVSLELTKTWHLVGKMQRQHRQLHTHEQILRYQLQQKRRLLNELKEELEYCRRKWAAARAKNDESQVQCDDLRREFAIRKIQDANNSAESGYSDGPISEDDEPNFKNAKPTKNYREIFNSNRKIERMQSESPKPIMFERVVRREKSAPPVANFVTEILQAAPTISVVQDLQSVAASSFVTQNATETAGVSVTSAKVVQSTASGTIPKQGVRLSRSKKREKATTSGESLEDMYMRLSGQCNSIQNESDQDNRAQRAVRINRLEEQCKSLIAQVIETSSCREELNAQLTRFQDELVPTPSAPVSDTAEASTSSDSSLGKNDEAVLTAREEEYIAKRSERLKRLEEESKQLMSRIKKTTDRGNNMKTVVDQLHLRCVNSREGSVDGNSSTDEQEKDNTKVNLTSDEEAYTARRAARLQRMEEESQLLLSKLSNNSQRGTDFNVKLDELHTRYGQQEFNNPLDTVSEIDNAQAVNDVNEGSADNSIEECKVTCSEATNESNHVEKISTVTESNDDNEAEEQQNGVTEKQVDNSDQN